LLDATRALLDEDVPFVDIRIETITVRAGISRSAFYDHYADKRELLMALVDAFMSPLFDQMEAYLGAPQARTASVGAAWNELLSAALAATFRNRSLVLAIREAAGYDREVAATWARLLGRVEAAVQHRIESQQKYGLAPPAAAEGMAVALVAMLEGSFVRQLRRPDDIAEAELIAGISTIWARSVYGAEATGEPIRFTADRDDGSLPG
jgi:AcrR family transcriptional regulator